MSRLEASLSPTQREFCTILKRDRSCEDVDASLAVNDYSLHDSRGRSAHDQGYLVPRPSHSRLHNEKLNSRGLSACYFVILIMNGTVLFTGILAESPPTTTITHRVVCFVCVLIRSDRRLVGLRVFIKSISLSTKFTLSARFRIRSLNRSTLLFSGKRAQALCGKFDIRKRAQRLGANHMKRANASFLLRASR